MKHYTFTPSVIELGSIPIPSNVSEVIANEPMIYGGSIDWCKKNAGTLTKQCIQSITDQLLWKQIVEGQANMGYHPVIDTKSVLLQEGQYPCIPGWHCDGVIRDKRGAQPDLNTLDEQVLHYACVINDACDTATQFLDEDIEIGIKENKSVWAQVDKAVCKKLDESESFPIYTPENGDIVEFTRSTLHNCPAANVRQWRYFFRLSFYHTPAMNEIRKQVNVYTDINQGW